MKLFVKENYLPMEYNEADPFRGSISDVISDFAFPFEELPTKINILKTHPTQKKEEKILIIKKIFV